MMKYVIMLTILLMSITCEHCLTLVAAQEAHPDVLKGVLKRASDFRGYSFSIHTEWYVAPDETNELIPQKVAEVVATGKGIAGQKLSFSYKKTSHIKMPRDIVNEFSYLFFYDNNRSVLWFENRTDPRDPIVIKYDFRESKALFPNPIVDDMGLIPGTDVPGTIRYWLTQYDLKENGANDQKGEELNYRGELKDGGALARLRLMGLDPSKLPEDFVKGYRDDVRKRFHRAKVVVKGNMVKEISFVSRSGDITQHTKLFRFEDNAHVQEGNFVYHPPKGLMIRKQAIE